MGINAPGPSGEKPSGRTHSRIVVHSESPALNRLHLAVSSFACSSTEDSGHSAQARQLAAIGGLSGSDEGAAHSAILVACQATTCHCWPWRSQASVNRRCRFCVWPLKITWTLVEPVRIATSPYARTTTPGSCSMETYLRSPVRSLSRNSALPSSAPLECTYERSLAKNFSSPSKSPLTSVTT